MRKWDAAAAQDLERGGCALTDSRGLPLDPHTVSVAGTIIRVIPMRAAESVAEHEHEHEHDAE